LLHNNLGGHSFGDLWKSICLSLALIMLSYLYKDVVALRSLNDAAYQISPIISNTIKKFIT